MTLSPWPYVALRLAALAAAGALLGHLFGHGFAWLAFFFAGALAWHLWHLWQLEAWLRRKLGEPPRDAAGVWGGVYAQLHRLRLQSRARKKRLARVLKEFRKSTQALPDGGVVLQADHAIAWVNPAAERLLGLRPADRGQRIENLLRSPEFAEFLRQDEHQRVLRMLSPLDERLRLELQVVPYGETQRLLLARDVTRESRLEAVRKTFVANASHELRSPVTVLSAYLDALQDDPDLPGNWREPVLEMVRQSERMRRIIDDLLTLSSLEAAAPEAELEVVDAVAMLRLLHQEALGAAVRPQTIELTLESDARLLGAEAEIFSAFSNVVNNAIKYTPAEGVVRLRWHKANGEACLTVTDTGPGIPAEAIPRLTERFYRVDRGRGRDTGGTGLGLAIVKNVLQRHGGRLEIESRLGEGSSFTCCFPADRVAVARSQEQ